MKRLLSIILAISMILALIPAAFATDTATEGFTVSTVKDSTTCLETKNIGNATGNSLTTTSYRWRAGNFTTEDAKFPVFDPAADNVNALAFKFKCTVGGKYIPTVNYSKYSNGIIAEVHIVTDEKMGDGLEAFVRSAGASTRIGTVDFYNSVSASVGEVSLTAGTDYWIIFIAIGENENRKNVGIPSSDPGYYTSVQYITSIEFAPVTDEALNVGDDVTYDFSTDALNLSTVNYTDTENLPANHLGYAGYNANNKGRTNYKGWLHKGSSEPSERNATKAHIRPDYNLKTAADGEFVGYEYINTDVSRKWMYAGQRRANNIWFESKDNNGLYFQVKKSNVSGNYVKLKIYVPSPGKYNVLISGDNKGSVYTDTTRPAETEFYISATETAGDDDKIGNFQFFNMTGDSIGVFEPDAAGDYYLTFKISDTDDARAAADAYITETWKDNEDENKRYTTWEAYYTNEKTANGGDISPCYGVNLKSLTLEYAGETTADAAVTAQKEAQQNPVINAAVADATEKEASTTNTVSLLKAFIGGDAANTTLTNKATETGGIYTVTADDAPEGYSFLYWTKGLEYDSKRIVSIDKTISFKPEIGGNYLIAVYGKTGDETETKKFINGNGQLITDATDENHTPSMPGYGAFKGWVDCGNGVYMAEYVGRESYTVTVRNDGEMVETRTPEYGSEVTVTAPARASDGYRLFAYWEKDDEIVSLDRKYTFYAFEDCTVNAVYNEYEPVATSLRKIILTNMGSNNYMAEFIGFGNAVEKGIAVGSKKIAMTTDKTQFTINADETGTVRGYAIDSEGNVYYSK